MGQEADWITRPLNSYQTGDLDSSPNITLKYTKRDEKKGGHQLSEN